MSDGNRGLLFELLETWSHRVTVDGLASTTWDLRCAIADDAHDAPLTASRVVAGH
jgi:hypothetical protein